MVAGGVDAPPALPQPATEKEKRTVTAKKSSTKLPTNQARYRAESGPMSALQYRAACNKLGLTTYRAMAKELGISKDSAHRYAKGQWDVPETVSKLLRALVALGTTEI